jgi:uncharacterized protein
MKALSCPNCTAPFKEVVREGILIDICPTCGGVFLDRGELEKLIALARIEAEMGSSPQAPVQAPIQPQPQYQQPMAPPPYAQPSYPQPRQDYRPEPRYEEHKSYKPYKRDDDDDYYRRYGHKRKKSKLEGLFDIFD